MIKPVIDAHCDLLSYLTTSDSDIYNTEDIGCAVPYLEAGNVKLQTMAIFAPVEKNSHLFGLKQSEIFADLDKNQSPFFSFNDNNLETLETNKGIGMLASIESGSAFCDENIPLNEGFKNLECIINTVKNVFYISFTHHAENRFGGGNYSEAGLKEDGKALIDFINGRKIAIDFSHTSDALAYDILNYLSKGNLDIPILASHSNYREVFDHPRNLPNDIATEIIRKNGLIGVNFLRAFVNNENPETLQKHIAHGLSLGAENNICYGADYFYTGENPDQSRLPFYHKEHENASCYPALNDSLTSQFGEEIADKISYKNAAGFLKRLWN